MGILGSEIIKARSWGLILRSNEVITAMKIPQRRGIAKEVNQQKMWNLQQNLQASNKVLRWEKVIIQWGSQSQIWIKTKMMLRLCIKRTYLLGDCTLRKKMSPNILRTYKHKFSRLSWPRGPNHYPGSLSEWGDRWNMWNDAEKSILIYLLIWEWGND